ncbi:hypothetical protein RUND412_008579 [Rhizina undulata]
MAVFVETIPDSYYMPNLDWCFATSSSTTTSVVLASLAAHPPATTASPLPQRPVAYTTSRSSSPSTRLLNPLNHLPRSTTTTVVSASSHNPPSNASDSAERKRRSIFAGGFSGSEEVLLEHPDDFKKVLDTYTDAEEAESLYSALTEGGRGSVHSVGLPFQGFRVEHEKVGRDRDMYRTSLAQELSPTSPSTSRSVTPLHLPLQKMEPAVVHQQRQHRLSGGDIMANRLSDPRSKSSTNNSWLGDPDPRDSIEMDLERGVKLNDMRISRNKTVSPTSINSSSPNPTPIDRPDSVVSHESEWNSTHPCYPHRNPHVPSSSPLYASTRIIRIQRDYTVTGDLSPAFSNIYPEILEPSLSEDRFRMVIARVNRELQTAFDPWNVWNWVDALVGLVTLWLVEEIVDTHVKRKLREVEAYLRAQNEELSRTENGAVFVPLRRTGYLNLDIQIPDPEIPDANYTDEEQIVEEEEIPDTKHYRGEASGGVVPKVVVNDAGRKGFR